MPDWKIWYGDGSTFSNLDGLPEDAPTLNVQVIAERNPKHNRRVWKARDYYWYEAGWCGGDLMGLYDYLARGGLRIVKFGRTIPDDDVYAAILADMNAEFGNHAGGKDRV